MSEHKKSGHKKDEGLINENPHNNHLFSMLGPDELIFC